MVLEASSGNDSHIESGGSIPDTANQPAFLLSKSQVPLTPILIAVPHAGREYPAQLLDRMRHPDESPLRLEDRLVDLVAEAVARATGAWLLTAQAPRAMLDLNRADDDVDWEMVSDKPLGQPISRRAGQRARNGLGLVPRRLSGLGELWNRRLTTGELGERIEQIHRPYHAKLGESLEQLKDQWGSALLIDLHSMPPLGPKRGSNPGADFVLGDRFGASCEPHLVARAISHLAGSQYLVEHNKPYAGGYVLDRHGMPLRGLNAMQIEICRATYLDEAMREPSAGLCEVVEALVSLVRVLADELIAGNLNRAQAAQ